MQNKIDNYIEVKKFDDVFISINNFFIVSALSYAIKKKEKDENYTFCIITKDDAKYYEKNAVNSLGGEIIIYTNIDNIHIICKNINVHSFGDIEWQKNIIPKITHDKLGIYGDFLKNWYVFTHFKTPFRVIQFGYIIDISTRPEHTSIEAVEFKYCFEAYRSLRNFCTQISIQNTSDIVLQDSSLNLVFLRYWGGGPYLFSDSITLGDAVLRGLPETKGIEWYIKGDPRIPQSSFEHTISYLNNNGYVAKDFSIICNTDSNTVNDLPAEFFLIDLKIGNGTAIVYDSSICFFLKIMGFNVIFPTMNTIDKLFLNPESYNTIMVWTKIYQEICSKIDLSADKNAIHTIKR